MTTGDLREAYSGEDSERWAVKFRQFLSILPYTSDTHKYADTRGGRGGSGARPAPHKDQPYTPQPQFLRTHSFLASILPR